MIINHELLAPFTEPSVFKQKSERIHKHLIYPGNRNRRELSISREIHGTQSLDLFPGLTETHRIWVMLELVPPGP